VKCRYIENGNIRFRVDGNEFGVSREIGNREMTLEMVGCSDGVLLSDYDKGVLTPELIGEISTACQKRSIPCVADCKRGPHIYKECVLKGNSDWNNKYGQSFINQVITLGARCPEVECVTVGAELPPVECVNHVGAGDCFAAHLTLALAYGFSLKDATALAHSAGRVYVQHPHSRPPGPEEIVADLDLALVTAS